MHFQKSNQKKGSNQVQTKFKPSSKTVNQVQIKFNNELILSNSRLLGTIRNLLGTTRYHSVPLSTIRNLFSTTRYHSELTRYHSVPLGTYSVPLGTYLVPLGTYSVPLGTYSVPLGTYLVPLGTYSVPLGTYSVPLGTYLEPTQNHPKSTKNQIPSGSKLILRVVRERRKSVLKVMCFLKVFQLIKKKSCKNNCSFLNKKKCTSIRILDSQL